MADFELSVALTGADGALGDVRRVQAANEAAAAAVVQLTRGSVEEIGKLREAKAREVEAAREVAAAYASLARTTSGAERAAAQERLAASRQVVEQAQREARAVDAAMRQATTATRATTSATVELGSTSRNVGQQAGQSFTAIGQSVSALGRGAPAVAALGATISQVGGAATALSGAFGPLGAAIAGVTALGAAFAAASNANAAALERERTAASSLTTSLDDLITAERRRRTESATRARLLRGGGDDVEQGALITQAENRVRLLQDALNRDAGRTDAQRGRTSGAIEVLAGEGLVPQASLAQGLFGRSTLSNSERGRVQAELTRAEAELTRATEARARSMSVVESGDPLAGVSMSTASPADIGAALSSARTSGRRGSRSSAGGGATATRAPTLDQLMEGFGRRPTDSVVDSILSRDRTADAPAANGGADDSAQRAARARFEEQGALWQQASDNARESATLAQQWRDQEASSLESLASSYRDTNAEIRRLGGQGIDTAELFSRGIQTIAGDIGDALVGGFAQNLQKSIGAILDGTATAEEAFAQLGKGIIRSLIDQAVVQVVVETASALGAAARYDFPGAALHAASALAWGAVGGAAIGIGAATGAFGGGDKAKSSVGSRVGDGASNNASSGSSSAGPREVNIYVSPGIMSTRDDVARALSDGMRDAQRMGYWEAA